LGEIKRQVEQKYKKCGEREKIMLRLLSVSLESIEKLMDVDVEDPDRLRSWVGA
jgi:hypothetical protein